MTKTGIFYGSATGNTEEVARMIARQLDIAPADIYNVANTAPSAVAPYTTLILGSSTWGDGDLEPDWFDFIDGLDALDLKGKNIALFGCGDETMTDTFCNAIGTLYTKLQPTGARFIGAFNTDGYSFEKSSAVVDGKAVGLTIDQMNRPELTEARVEAWCKQIAAEA